jgi:hypothetical protein
VQELVKAVINRQVVPERSGNEVNGIVLYPGRLALCCNFSNLIR